MRLASWTKAVAALAAVTLVGACSQPANTTTSGVGDKDVATGGRLFSTADAETAKLKADVGPGVFPRTVTHALGQTKLEKKPTRVVVLDSGEPTTCWHSASRPSAWRPPRARPACRPTSPTGSRGSRRSATSTT
ncbi:hypothetical protein [Amycolatopsis sp. NBC_01480]|uniref:hypothetical protein n=1 Tax=Amycolatopsis sp. NBC_01480 TaxID=2903562 RepID=UPI002E2D309D|nr:hypothetical protein [Amycolatopsis sp. NBC_01480]